MGQTPRAHAHHAPRAPSPLAISLAVLVRAVSPLILRALHALLPSPQTSRPALLAPARCPRPCRLPSSNPRVPRAPRFHAYVRARTPPAQHARSPRQSSFAVLAGVASRSECSTAPRSRRASPSIHRRAVRIHTLRPSGALRRASGPRGDEALGLVHAGSRARSAARSPSPSAPSQPQPARSTPPRFYPDVPRTYAPRCP